MIKYLILGSSIGSLFYILNLIKKYDNINSKKIIDLIYKTN